MIMAEENSQGKELLGRAKKPLAAPPTGGGPGGRGLTGFFGEMRAIFTKFSGKDKKPAGIVTPAALRKSPLSQVLEAFSLQKLDLKFINQILIVVLIGLVMVTCYVMFRKRPDATAVKAAVSKINFSEMEPAPTAAFQNVAYYLEQAETRDIFNVFFEEPEPVVVVPVEPEEPPEPPPPPKVPIEEKARNLKLIGISWGNDPKAIIQDQKTQEVHFVAEGELIQGTEVSVKEIKKDKVILFSEEDTMSLL
jgi:hypothetical protein